MNNRSVRRVSNVEGILFGALGVASFSGCKELFTFEPLKVALIGALTFGITFYSVRNMARLNFENGKPYIERDWRTVDLWARNHQAHAMKAVGLAFIACILLSYWDRPFLIALIAPVLLLGAAWHLIPNIGGLARSSWREDTSDRVREGMADTIGGQRPPTQGTRFGTRTDRAAGDLEDESDLERLRRHVRGD